jgi:uncharacterized protein YbaA (DUF1428 family)
MTNEMEAAKPHKQTNHTPMTHYIDGFVIPLPKNKIDDYRRIAQKAGEVWRDHGALEYRECVGEDLDVEAQVPFPHLMDASAMPFDCKRMAYGGFQVVVEDFPPGPDRVMRSQPGHVSHSQPAHLD